MRFPKWRLEQHLFHRTTNDTNQVSLRLFSILGRTIGMEYDVMHDETNKEFYIDIGEERAVLQYQILDGNNKVMDIYHTGVPESQRGKGVAGHLLKAAFSFLIAKDLKVRPTCSYVEHYINKHRPPEIVQRLEKE